MRSLAVRPLLGAAHLGTAHTRLRVGGSPLLIIEESVAGLAVGTEAVHVEGVVEAMFMATPIWNFLLVAIAVALANAFERFVEALEAAVPTRLLPVLQKSVSEFATIGFVGLVIEVVSTGESTSGWLQSVSETFLGEKDFLLDQFAHISNLLSSVILIYFAACALLVLRVERRFNEWGAGRRNGYLNFKMAEYDWKQTQADSQASFPLRGFSQLAANMVMTQPGVLGAGRSRRATTRGIGLLDELCASSETRIAEYLRFRERFIDQTRRAGLFIPTQFRFNQYLEQTASQKLRALVTLEPAALAWTWAPWALISWLAEVIDISYSGQTMAGNALLQAEYASLEIVFAASQLVLAALALWNFGKLHLIKKLLRPQLASRLASDGATLTRRLLPPPYALKAGSAALPAAREPGWLASLLKPFALPARTAHERAFGTLGAAGPSWLLLSQKVVLFNAIVSIVVGLDLASSADGAGGSAFADPVLAACLIPAVMAIALAPATFLVFNWVTAVEGLKDMPALREVLSAQRKTTFDASITTLANLCDCFRVCSADGCFIPPETDVAIRPWPTLRDEFADNPDPLANLMLVFDEADANSDGWISCTELGRLARILGFELDRSQLQSFYEQAMELQGGGAVEAAGADGGDGEQLLDFAAFASVVLNQPRARGEGEDAAPDEVICRAVFSFFDRSQNGILTVHEMTTSLERLGFDTAGTEQLFRDVAGAPQDTVSYEQFAWYCTEAGL